MCICRLAFWKTKGAVTRPCGRLGLGVDGFDDCAKCSAAHTAALIRGVWLKVGRRSLKQPRRPSISVSETTEQSSFYLNTAIVLGPAKAVKIRKLFDVPLVQSHRHLVLPFSKLCGQITTKASRYSNLTSAACPTTENRRRVLTLRLLEQRIA